MVIQTNFFSRNLLMTLSLWGDLIRSLVFNLCYGIWMALKIRYSGYLFFLLFWIIIKKCCINCVVSSCLLLILSLLFITSPGILPCCMLRKYVKGMHLPFHSKMLLKSLFPSKVQTEKVRHSSDSHTAVHICKRIIAKVVLVVQH